MFKEILKAQRNIKGFTQEELAMELNIVRQTISKWEKGLSLPDADMLVKIADIFQISVTTLLGLDIDIESDRSGNIVLIEQLAKINEQLAIKNRRSDSIWKIIRIIIISVICFIIIDIFWFISMILGS